MGKSSIFINGYISDYSGYNKIKDEGANCIWKRQWKDLQSLYICILLLTKDSNEISYKGLSQFPNANIINLKSLILSKYSNNSDNNPIGIYYIGINKGKLIYI